MKFTKARVHSAAYNTCTDLAGGNNPKCVSTSVLMTNCLIHLEHLLESV